MQFVPLGLIGLDLLQQGRRFGAVQAPAILCLIEATEVYSVITPLVILMLSENSRAEPGCPRWPSDQ